MKIRQKTLNLTLILVVIFSILIFTKVESFALSTQLPLTSQTPTTQTLGPVKQIKQGKVPTTVPEQNAYALSHMEKTGFKYTVFKFFISMIGVLVSALAIFIGLKLYKNFILKNNAKLNNIDYDKTLESPKDFKEAINLFLDKTDR